MYEYELVSGSISMDDESEEKLKKQIGSNETISLRSSNFKKVSLNVEMKSEINEFKNCK